MADVHSVASEETNVNLSEHIEKLTKAFDSSVKLAKVIGRAQGDKTLKNGSKMKLQDGTEIGLEDLNQQISKIKTELRRIPRIIATLKRSERAAKKAKHAGRESTQTPHQYLSPLIEFFKSSDLGRAADGRTRLQDMPDMQLFFQSGVGNLTFGVSLFNVWGSIYKLNNKTQEIVLDSASQRALHDALEALKTKKQDNISLARAAISKASNDEERKLAEKALEDAQMDLERLRANKIQNKDYMGILSHYRIKENPNDLTSFADGVSKMCEITKGRNFEYREMILKSREGEKKTTKATGVVPVAAPVPTLPSLKPMVPTVPTISVRGASPTTKRR